ncbi:hypothetical protein BHYA_0052g00360 [Botrytis hyacinthi]|uniref:Trichothecene 3-O-acetyltransferase-like N-terminal domain-containing protein n=1 Tax=Botrytis hyacinthi TaxID=278943 RepID=A0A4Z1H2C7_9HELO|nr:hypothetical protein BHYA_0052g00360 [Botrytis hyacinthi]
MAPKTHTHIPLSPFDHVPPVIHVTAVMYLPLKAGVNPAQAFEILQTGLKSTFVTIPWLSDKVWPQDSKAPGWRPGQLEIRHGVVDIDSPSPYQLKFKQLESDYSYEELKEESFLPNSFEYEDIMWAPFIPPTDKGAEVFVAQANLIPGGCILTQAIHHADMRFHLCIGNEGNPEGFSVLMGEFKKWTRICFVLPRKKNGGSGFGTRRETRLERRTNLLYW